MDEEEQPGAKGGRASMILTEERKSAPACVYVHLLPVAY